MYTACHRVLACCLAMLLLFSALPALSEEPPRVLRAGFFAFEGYHMMDENGARSGYGYDVLQLMAAYANWTYDYVGYDRTWKDMLDMLAAGELDLVTSAQKTPEREQEFSFSTLPVGMSSTLVTARAGEARFLPGDYAQWNGIRVGLLTGNSRNQSFDQFARTQGFAYQPVYYGTDAELRDALFDDPEVDVIVTSSLRYLRNEWVLAEFDASPFYAVVRKGDTALLQEVNAALEQLEYTDPDFRTRLRNRYYAVQSGEQISYTVEERAFIASMQGTVLTAALCPDCAPLSWFADRTAQGIIPEITAEIIRRTGLDIRVAYMATHEAYDALVQSGELDIQLDAWNDPASAEAAGYKLTVPYLESSVSRLYRKNSLPMEGGKVATALGKRLTNSLFTALGLTGEVLPCANVSDVSRAVLEGRASTALLYTLSAEKLRAEDRANRFATDTLYGYSLGFSIGVSNRWNVLLLRVLNKAVSSLSTGTVEEIVKRHSVHVDASPSLVNFLYDNPAVFAVMLTSFLLLVFLLVLAILFAARRRRDRAQMIEDARQRELLRDALAAAERADHAKSQFLSRISHEMRTPLNAIIGFLTLSRLDDCTPAKQRTYLDDSEIAAKQLLGIINDVLDMSAIDAGRLQIQKEPFDLGALVSSLARVYGTQCRQKGVAFETNLLTPVDEILVGDSLRLNQILTNLLGNAVKFTQAGTVCLTVSQTETDDRVFLQLVVTDTGCGMSEEMMQNLFKPFVQESAATTRRYGGSGLGLSIVKNLVTMMKGAISVKSVRDQGSTFSVQLPFQRVAPQENTPSIDWADLRVLVADDQPQDCAYIASMLMRIGVRHLCVNSGQAALDELLRARGQTERYAICLVDEKLPSIDGVPVTRLLRDHCAQGMVIVVLSAYERELDERAKHDGIDAFVTKPLFQSTLFNLLINLSGGGQMRDAAQPDTSLAGRRLLLAEDNKMNLIVAEGFLTHNGLLYDTALDGREAVEKFLAAPNGYYDAILMDIQMPVLDGLSATREIRASGREDARTVPIIALTANAFNEDIAAALQGGMNAHIAKPIDVDVMMDTLRRWIPPR